MTVNSTMTISVFVQQKMSVTAPACITSLCHSNISLFYWNILQSNFGATHCCCCQSHFLQFLCSGSWWLHFRIVSVLSQNQYRFPISFGFKAKWNCCRNIEWIPCKCYDTVTSSRNQLQSVHYSVFSCRALLQHIT